MMKQLLTLSLGAAILLSGCARPLEVRSVSAAALPIATNLKGSAENLQTRFAAQRKTLDGRANDLAMQAANARVTSNQIEQDWRYLGDTAKPKLLALLRENDDAILADPLASVATPAPAIATGKPPGLDLAPLNKVVDALGKLRSERKMGHGELFGFFISVNTKLCELGKEQSGSSENCEAPGQ